MAFLDITKMGPAYCVLGPKLPIMLWRGRGHAAAAVAAVSYGDISQICKHNTETDTDLKADGLQ
jgi:hypothetical protein